MKMEKLPTVDPLEAARDALAESKGNANRATAALTASAKEDAALLHALAALAISMASPDEGVAMRHQRRKAWTAPNYDVGGNGHRVHALAAGNAMMLMDFPLMDGTPLRNATREEVRVNAEGYYKQASDMRWKSRWLALVASKIPQQDDKKTVGQALTESVLRELQEKAKHGK